MKNAFTSGVRRWCAAQARQWCQVLCGWLLLVSIVYAADAALIHHGAYLARAADCIGCHTAPGGMPLAGGRALDTPVGVIYSTNITPSLTHGIGHYTPELFAQALRQGIRADGMHLYPAMPYPAYAQLTEADVYALYAYVMQGVASVDALPAGKTSLAFPFSVRGGMAVWNTLFHDAAPFTPNPDQSGSLNRGAYLVQAVAHCGSCHTPQVVPWVQDVTQALGGGRQGQWLAPNITSDMNSGVGGWQRQEIVSFLKTGRTESKAQASGPMAELIDRSLSHMSESDLHAIAEYLLATLPVEDGMDSKPVHAMRPQQDSTLQYDRLALAADTEGEVTGVRLYARHCASCHQMDGAGDPDRGPSLFYNTVVGRHQTDNLVLVILEGIRRQPEAGGETMPGFADALSDDEIALLGNYVVQQFGNPAATVSAAQVSRLREGGGILWVVWLARTALLLVCVLVLLLLRRLLRLKLRRGQR